MKPVTEEKASKLLCPMSFGAGFDETARCVGSDCMWWVEAKEAIKPKSFLWKNDETKKETKGTCGVLAKLINEGEKECD